MANEPSEGTSWQTPHGMRPSPLQSALVLLFFAALTVARAQAPATGLTEDMIFGDYTPLATSSELVRRLLSPLAAREVKANLARSGEKLIEESVDLKSEHFVLYVPVVAPPDGYALLAFVPPWQEARLPAGWAGVLDRFGVIYVSAARSGNDENVLGRRAPLSLLAAYNVMQRYHVNPARVWIGGFSGGSRVALRIAIGYPDLFTGAFLNAGSDPIGTVPSLPGDSLWQRFEQTMRLVYVTGEHDTTHLASDADSLHSMRRWCVFDAEAQVTAGAAHELASPNALAGALQVLERAASPPAASRLAACRAGIEKDLDGELRQVDELIRTGKDKQASERLLDIDRRFGGLAAPRSLELAEKQSAAGPQ
jgi:hypothetical protein